MEISDLWLRLEGKLGYNESCMLNCLGKINIGKARHPGILVDLQITISWVIN